MFDIDLESEDTSDVEVSVGIHSIRRNCYNSGCKREPFRTKDQHTAATFRQTFTSTDLLFFFSLFCRTKFVTSPYPKQNRRYFLTGLISGSKIK